VEPDSTPALFYEILASLDLFSFLSEDLFKAFSLAPNGTVYFEDSGRQSLKATGPPTTYD
jgi:hypothetical protein